MAGPVPKGKATYQDVLDAPENMVAEIIGGDLRLSPRPGGPHTSASSRLGYLLGPPFDLGSGGPGGWIILAEPELHLGEDIVVPELAGWRRDRMPEVAQDAFFTLAPDWVCETLSKSTEKMDRAEKLPIYSAAGVGHSWLVSPRTKTLEVYRRQDDKWLLLVVHQRDEEVRAEPFEAIEIDLALLWADVAPPRPRGTRASEGAAQYEYDE